MRKGDNIMVAAPYKFNKIFASMALVAHDTYVRFIYIYVLRPFE